MARGGFAIVSAGFAGDYGFHVFFGILCLLLVICCTMFVLVIASLMKAEYGSALGPGPEE